MEREQRIPTQEEIDAMSLLETARYARKELSWIAEEWERVSSLLTSIPTQAYDRPAVQTSHDPDKWTGLLERKLSLEESLLDAACVYVDARMKVASRLMHVNGAAREVIRDVYLSDMTIQEAADKAAVSYGYARNVASKAAEYMTGK